MRTFVLLSLVLGIAAYATPSTTIEEKRDQYTCDRLDPAFDSTTNKCISEFKAPCDAPCFKLLSAFFDNCKDDADPTTQQYASDVKSGMEAAGCEPTLMLGIAAYATPGAKEKSGGCGDDCVFDDDCDAGLCGACDLGICGPSKLKSAIKELAAIKAAVAISSLNSTNAKSKSGGCGDDCDFDSDCDAGLCGSCTLFTCV